MSEPDGKSGKAAAVLKATATYFDISLEALMGKRGPQEIVDARHIAMYLLREDLRLRPKDICVAIGGRDHSTVLHALDKVKALTDDEQFRRQLEEIRGMYA